mgnify:CR=1 FL=1
MYGGWASWVALVDVRVGVAADPSSGLAATRALLRRMPGWPPAMLLEAQALAALGQDAQAKHILAALLPGRPFTRKKALADPRLAKLVEPA